LVLHWIQTLRHTDHVTLAERAFTLTQWTLLVAGLVFVLLLTLVLGIPILAVSFLLVIAFVMFVFQGAIRVHYMCWTLDTLAQSVANHSKTVNLAQAEVVAMFELQVGNLGNDDVLRLFFKIVRFTAEEAKWAFIRQENAVRLR
jgi:hypothetical protein